MNLFKQKLLGYLNSRANRKSKFLHINTSFQESKDIGLIFTWEGEAKYLQVLDLIKFLEIHGKNAFILCYVRNQKEIVTAEIPVYYDRDISMFGKLKTNIIGNFIAHPFDFLLNLDLGPSIMVQSVLSRTQARCRVGKIDMIHQEFYELMIRPSEENDYKNFYDQVLHYTKSITTYA